jgi:hypothetical protein
LKLIVIVLLASIIIIGTYSSVACTSYQPISAAQNANANTDVNSKSMNFTKPFNLTNNTKDSVYAQVASHGNNVYVVWQENNPGYQDNKNNKYSNNIKYNFSNYDIYIKKSVDGGLTFSKEINLSNNPGFSEHPQIAISGNSVYVAWIDDTLPASTSHPKALKRFNEEILFRKSIDGGNTFDKVINLSNSSDADSYNQEIAAAENNVYVVWQDTDRSSISGHKNSWDSSIAFRASTDSGDSFQKIKSLGSAGFDSFPKIAAFGNSAYLVWNFGIIGDTNKYTYNINNKTSSGIFFTKSLDSGNSFSHTVKLNSNRNSIGEPQVAAYNNNVYVIWGGNPDDKVEGNMFFVRSSNNGNSFSKAVSLSGDQKNTLNVEVIAGGNNNVYVAWQALLSDDNEEILFKKSSDNGATFTNTHENISKNKGISECTSIAVSENNIVYLAWEDDTTGNHEILFVKTV